MAGVELPLEGRGKRSDAWLRGRVYERYVRLAVTWLWLGQAQGPFGQADAESCQNTSTSRSTMVCICWRASGTWARPNR